MGGGIRKNRDKKQKRVACCSLYKFGQSFLSTMNISRHKTNATKITWSTNSVFSEWACI